ncbi:hypothetical protein LshimejAT787_2600400 [Lyophyllum shimeji]|uniref:Uncharacterized protein n=1 Tax=Lyophyllum shimeji TaxID=47721 RepID=A0A9P3Q2N7_LYOSH|nr:hypothetical protein LshimejAT787_2600400 [Lyophyllum shimeji]
MLPILRLFLERSYPSDLSVSVQIQEAGDPQQDPCFDELVLHSERWGHLHLDVFPRLIPKLNTVKNRVSALRTLSLQSNATRALSYDAVVDAFEYAPLLRNVATHGAKPTALRIPWHQITNLTFDPPDTIGMEWAQQCSNLQSLTIYPTMLPNGHIIHPLLGHFTTSLGLQSPPNALGIFSRFTTPNLLSLIIKSASPNKYFIWFHSEFLAFVARSPPFALREFALINLYTDMTADQLIECLRVLPSLQTLKIVETYRKPLFTHEVCHALTRRAYDVDDYSDEMSSMHLSPMLTTLYLGEGAIVDPESLADMLESRLPHIGDPCYDELASLTSLTLGAVFWALPRKDARRATSDVLHCGAALHAADTVSLFALVFMVIFYLAYFPLAPFRPNEIMQLVAVLCGSRSVPVVIITVLFSQSRSPRFAPAAAALPAQKYTRTPSPDLVSTPSISRICFPLSPRAQSGSQKESTVG